MTTGEACELCALQTRRLDTARREGEVWRLLATQLAFRMSAMAKDLAVEKRRRFSLLDERRAIRGQVQSTLQLPDREIPTHGNLPNQVTGHAVSAEVHG